MADSIVVPELPEAPEGATLGRWVKQLGQEVERGETVAEIEYDKAVRPIDAPVSGVLLACLADEEEVVRRGDVIGWIGVVGETPPDRRPVSLPDGAAPGDAVPSNRSVSRLCGHQGTIAKRVIASVREKPVIHVNVSVDMTRAVAFLEEYNSGPPVVELRYDGLFIFALGRLLKRFPNFRRYMRQDDILQIGGINVGFAVSIEDRLFLPVIRDADQKTIQQICEDFEQLVNRTFDRCLTTEDLAGSCLIVSNLGMYPIDSFDAIIYPRNSAALAVGAIARRPVVVDDEIVIRPLMRITLTVDHRLINGKEAAVFLTRLKKSLENAAFR